MADFEIRRLQRADFQQWRGLWDGYNRFYERTGSITDEITETTFGRFFDAYEPMHAAVAVDAAGDLIGFVDYIFHRNTAMVGPVCYLQDLFTSEAARGKGVGKALIEATYDAARKVGSPRVYWQTHETNVTAQRLYNAVAEKSGFIVYRKQV